MFCFMSPCLYLAVHPLAVPPPQARWVRGAAGTDTPARSGHASSRWGRFEVAVCHTAWINTSPVYTLITHSD